PRTRRWSPSGAPALCACPSRRSPPSWAGRSRSFRARGRDGRDGRDADRSRRGRELPAVGVAAPAERLPVRADLLGVRQARHRRARSPARHRARGVAAPALPPVSSRRRGPSADPDAPAVTMEKRAILAAVLVAAVFIVYQTYFFPVEPPQQKPPAQTTQTEPARAPAPAPAATPAEASKAAPPVSVPGVPRPPQRLTTVDAPLYRAVVSSEGGKLQELALKYRGEKPVVMIGDLGPAGLLAPPAPSAAPKPVPRTVSTETVSVTPGRAESLALAGETGGLRVRQSLRFEPDSYAIAVSIRVENPTSAPRKATVELPWASRISWAGVPEKFPGQHPIEVVWSIHGSVDRSPHWMSPTLEGLVDHQPKLGEGDWIAIGSVWYLAALLPKAGGFQLVTSVEKPEEAKDGREAAPGRVAIGVRATPEIAPGKAWEGEVTMFAGPKEYRLLEGLKLEETLNFGGFPIPWYWGGLPMRWIGVPILWLMNWTYKHVGNYGIAIILLTVISKVLF